MVPLNTKEPANPGESTNKIEFIYPKQRKLTNLNQRYLGGCPHASKYCSIHHSLT